MEIKTLDLQGKELKDLNREVSTNEMNYKTYQEKKEEARISDEMNRQKLANISVIQAAVVPSRPVKPKKALNILLEHHPGGRLRAGVRLLVRIHRPGIFHPRQRGAAPGAAGAGDHIV